jgi:hypothetical protein
LAFCPVSSIGAWRRGRERERENMWGIINNEREKTQQLPLFCGMDHRRREKSSQEQGGSEGENG